MDELSDETLMAYADGCLDDAMRQRISAALETDPALRQRLEPFIITGPGLAELFSEPLSEPVPARLLRTVLTYEPQVRIGLWDRILQVLQPQHWNPAFAAACASCLVLGASTAWLARAPGNPGNQNPIAVSSGEITAAGVLRTALETSPGNTPITAAGTTARPKLTFASQDGWCREYDLAMAPGTTFAGVACRRSDGTWRIEAHAPAETASAAASDVSPAAKAEPPASVEGAVDRLRTADVLTGAEEQVVIRNGWTK